MGFGRFWSGSGNAIDNPSMFYVKINLIWKGRALELFFGY